MQVKRALKGSEKSEWALFQDWVFCEIYSSRIMAD